MRYRRKRRWTVIQKTVHSRIIEIRDKFIYNRIIVQLRILHNIFYIHLKESVLLNYDTIVIRKEEKWSTLPWNRIMEHQYHGLH